MEQIKERYKLAIELLKDYKSRLEEAIIECEERNTPELQDIIRGCKASIQEVKEEIYCYEQAIETGVYISRQLREAAKALKERKDKAKDEPQEI